MPTDARPPAGLCDGCVHQQLVSNTRGSTFSLCRRSRTDDAYPKYPRLPVRACPGYEPRGDHFDFETPDRSSTR